MTFHTTRWSLVLAAGRGDATGAAALGELCAAYWPPVYALFRRAGIDAATAQDLTQGLFADLLERGDLTRADPARGRFRGFLRGCARHWLANQRDQARAQRRGGGVAPLRLDVAAEEQRLGAEPVDRLDPEAWFERRWAQTVIERATARLQRDEALAGRSAQCAALQFVLEGSPPPRPWAELAAAQGVSEGALKVAAHRLKGRFRECLIAEVRDTLPEGESEGDELRELLLALGAPGGAV